MRDDKAVQDGTFSLLSTMLSIPIEKRSNVAQSLVLLKCGKWLLVASVEGEKNLFTDGKCKKIFFPL